MRPSIISEVQLLYCTTCSVCLEWGPNNRINKNGDKRSERAVKAFCDYFLVFDSALNGIQNVSMGSDIVNLSSNAFKNQQILISNGCCQQ